MLTDTDRLRNLLGRYCDLMDAGDFDGVGALFADATMAAGDGPPFLEGGTAIATFFRNGTQLHDGTPRTKHLILNTQFDEPAIDGTVVARSSYVVLQAVDGLLLQPIITGRYVDTFGRDAEDAWCFVERRFHVDLVGDLSRHLADPSIARPGATS
ncbi:nuclear transport factor 2 family protein [Aquihabitans daechungensis]|uniref:nuclear transport factor 2 family protein n=1 Tax=Aquihabitans daechungensis TaxID=1052257 RepID=UPI003BA1462A